MAKIGKSRRQYLKNYLWETWYWTSWFQRIYHRKPEKNELKKLENILKHNKVEEYDEWSKIYEIIYRNNQRLNIKLWNKSYPSYRDDTFVYVVNHKTGNIYVIDWLNEQSIPKEAKEDNCYTIYRNKFALQEYVDNKIRKGVVPGTNKLVGRSRNKQQILYVKKISMKNSQIEVFNKNDFAKLIGTRSNNLPHYYNKVRGHKGYWISLDSKSLVFNNPVLPKYAHYTEWKR